jgi:hypothetical protein
MTTASTNVAPGTLANASPAVSASDSPKGLTRTDATIMSRTLLRPRLHSPSAALGTMILTFVQPRQSHRDPHTVITSLKGYERPVSKVKPSTSRRQQSSHHRTCSGAGSA